MRNVFVSLAVVAVVGSAAYAGESQSTSPMTDNAQCSAEVTLRGGSVAAGIGYTWGNGELKYQDAAHAFTIKGVSVVDVGATNFSAVGKVCNLERLADFSGNYVAAGAGVTVAGGGTAVYLKNEHGVVIKLIGTDVGLKFKLSADSVLVALKG